MTRIEMAKKILVFVQVSIFESVCKLPTGTVKNWERTEVPSFRSIDGNVSFSSKLKNLFIQCLSIELNFNFV